MDTNNSMILYTILTENSILKNENITLKKERDELYLQHSNNYILLKQKEDEINILKLQNTNLLIEIDFLKKENIELQNKIVKLEEIIFQQNIRIDILEKENAEIKKENAEIKKENAEIKKELKYFKDNHYINKLIFSIQDLNHIYEFEKNIKKTNFTRLRLQRNDNCHYIFDDEEDFIQFKKKQIIIEKLIYIDCDIKKQIEKRYGNGIIEKIIQYMQPILENESKTILTNCEYSDEDIDNFVSYFWE